MQPESATEPGVADVMDTVRQRGHLMRQLLDGTTDRSVLVTEMDESRSTVYRGLDQLADADLATELCGGEYIPTVFGKLVFQAYNQYNVTATKLTGLRDVLDELPFESDIDPSIFAGAEVTVSESHAPMKPLTTVTQFVRDAAQIKGLVPVALPREIELVYEQISTDKVTAELVVTSKVFSYLRAEYAEEVSEILATQPASIQKTDSELPYGLLLTGTSPQRMELVIYSSSGNPKMVVENDTQDAIHWATATYNRYQDGGVRIEGDEPNALFE